MCGGVEYGKCEICGKETYLNRTYFYYPIHCECCGSKDKDGQNQHFVIVKHCNKCPAPMPKEIHPLIKAMDNKCYRANITNILPSDVDGEFIINDKITEIDGIEIVSPKKVKTHKENNKIKFKPIEEVTYEDIAKELFKDKIASVVNDCDNESITTRMVEDDYNYPVCCTSKKQAKKLLAINKLMNVAKYLNSNSKLCVDNFCYIYIHCDQLYIGRTNVNNHMDITFYNEKLANEAIKILGIETIKLALSKDY